MSLFDLLFKSSKSDPLYKLEKICGYHFRNRSYLKQAFTHRSITSNPRKNYERLEFLGDAVIDIVISKELMKEFPESDEGILTQKRSALVQKSFLSSMGRLLNLLDFLIIDSTVDLDQDKIAIKQAANLYEALIGAIYLDKGHLIEFCHIKQLPNPKFLITDVSGPDHQKLFEVHVKIGENVYPSGIGSNKKAAEQNAAQNAIDILMD